jgi:ribosome biogenesis GTPase / thiamine phosphate phosphatase
VTLLTFGWTEQRQHDFADHARAGLLPGRIVGEHRTHFQIATDIGELTGEISGRLRNTAAQRSDLPGVGDFVALRLAEGDGPATIDTVLPRSSALIRKAAGEQRPQLIAANIDVIFIVTGLDGDFNLERIERYLALVAESSARPVIVANKIDLADDLEGVTKQITALAPAVALHTISARGRTGVADLERYFAGNKTIALVGSSGAGKSTLTNQLIGRDAQATQDVRAHDSRGRHTTTHRQMFICPGGGTLIDTPGMRGLELWNPLHNAADDYGDIEVLATDCKFSNCQHRTEPGCAVRAALKNGTLDADRFAKYAQLPRG